MTGKHNFGVTGLCQGQEGVGRERMEQTEMRGEEGEEGRRGKGERDRKGMGGKRGREREREFVQKSNQ